MNRYPALGFYRGAMSLLGWGIVILGIIGAIMVSSSNRYGYGSYNNFQWEIFIPILLIALVTGGGFLITSELIGVLVNIESRLIEMRDMERRREAGDRAAAGVYIGESVASVPRSVDVQENESVFGDSVFKRRAVQELGSKPAQTFQEAAAQGVKSVWGVVTGDYLLLRTAPNANAPRVKKVILGEEIKVVGVSPDFDWALILDSDKKFYWARTGGITVNDSLNELHIVQA